MFYAAMEAGRLGWDLEQYTPHRAGELLRITFSITNLTPEEREFVIYMGLFDMAGSVIMTWPLPDPYIVPGDTEELHPESLLIEYSNCILQASLYDLQTGRMGATLRTILEQPEPLLTPIDWAGQVAGGFTGIAVTAMIAELLPELMID